MTNGDVIRKLLSGCNITDEELAKIRICPYNVAATCNADIPCDDCRLKWLKEECKSFETADGLYKGGAKIMTNGDKLRETMTDENIAKNYFCAFYDDCPDCPLYKIVECENIDTRLGWLRSESDRDARAD